MDPRLDATPSPNQRQLSDGARILDPIQTIANALQQFKAGNAPATYATDLDAGLSLLLEGHDTLRSENTRANLRSSLTIQAIFDVASTVVLHRADVVYKPFVEIAHNLIRNCLRISEELYPSPATEPVKLRIRAAALISHDRMRSIALLEVLPNTRPSLYDNPGVRLTPRERGELAPAAREILRNLADALPSDTLLFLGRIALSSLSTVPVEERSPLIAGIFRALDRNQRLHPKRTGMDRVLYGFDRQERLLPELAPSVQYLVHAARARTSEIHGDWGDAAESYSKAIEALTDHGCAATHPRILQLVQGLVSAKVHENDWSTAYAIAKSYDQEIAATTTASNRAKIEAQRVVAFVELQSNQKLPEAIHRLVRLINGMNPAGTLLERELYVTLLLDFAEATSHCLEFDAALLATSDAMAEASHFRTTSPETYERAALRHAESLARCGDHRRGLSTIVTAVGHAEESKLRGDLYALGRDLAEGLKDVARHDDLLARGLAWHEANTPFTDPRPRILKTVGLRFQLERVATERNWPELTEKLVATKEYLLELQRTNLNRDPEILALIAIAIQGARSVDAEILKTWFIAHQNEVSMWARRPAHTQNQDEDEFD